MPNSVTVTGSLNGTVASFTMRQDFKTEDAPAAELKYLVSTNGKMCMYDTTFYVGDEVIKPEIREKGEAETTYKDAVNEGRVAVHAYSRFDDLVEFALGNVPAGVSVGVEVKVSCFCSAGSDGHSMFVKFPFHVNTSSSYGESLMKLIRNEFKFTFDCSRAGDQIKTVTSNAKNGVYNQQTHVFSISGKDDNLDAIIMTMRFHDALQDSVTVAGKYMALTLFGRSLDSLLPADADASKNEFVFVVDCSGSMNGVRIKQAKLCLDLFIRSLPIGCYFNVIRFGSNYKTLFKTSTEYNKKTFSKAVKYANAIEADLGGTELFEVLHFVLKSRPVRGKKRQIFVLTDGEAPFLDKTLRLASEHSYNNRIFTLGIGTGADPGIVEGLADCTGGLCAFVLDEDNFGNKVIPALEASMKPGLRNVNIHIEGHETVESSISPIPCLFGGVGATLILKSDKEFTGEEAVLLTGDIGDVKDVELPITNSTCLDEHFSHALEVLFAYSRISQLQRLLNGREIGNEKLRQELVSLSIASGILSQETSFVGFSSESYGCQEFVMPVVHVDVDTMEFKKEHAKGSLMGGFFSWLGSLFQKRRPSQRIEAESLTKEEEPSDSLDAADELQTPTELTMKLVAGLQTAEGYWTGIEPIVGLLEKKPTMPTIKDLPSDEEQKRKVYQTIYALAILRHKFMADHASWKLMEQKALSWLNSVSSATDWETAIQEIQQQL